MNCLHATPFDRSFCCGHFLGAFRLFLHVAVTGGVFPRENRGSKRAAKIAIKALIPDVERARRVLGPATFEIEDRHLSSPNVQDEPCGPLARIGSGDWFGFFLFSLQLSSERKTKRPLEK